MGLTCEAESVRLNVRLSALVAQLQLMVRLSGPSSSSTLKEAQEGRREGERLGWSMGARLKGTSCVQAFDESCCGIRQTEFGNCSRAHRRTLKKLALQGREVRKGRGTTNGRPSRN